MRTLYFLFSFLFLQTAWPQQQATPAEKVMAGLQQKAEMAENSLVKNIPLKNIGPSVMSGRVVDLDVNPEDPTEFYVAYASGQTWSARVIILHSRAKINWQNQNEE